MTKDQTREKILLVAARIFGKYGFQKTTIDEIARTAHKAKGSVYYYFKSKEALFLAVVTQEINVLKSGLTRVIVDSQDATGMIKNYLMSRMILMKAVLDRGVRGNAFQIKDTKATTQVIILAMKRKH